MISQIVYSFQTFEKPADFIFLIFYFTFFSSILTCIYIFGLLLRLLLKVIRVTNVHNNGLKWTKTALKASVEGQSPPQELEICAPRKEEQMFCSI